LSKDAANAQQQCLTLSGNAAIIPALFEAEARERKIARQVVWLQILVTLTGASIAYSMKGTPQFALAVLCGGGVSVANGTLLAWRMSRPASSFASEAHHPLGVTHQLRLLYFYAAERFLVVVTLLSLCMAALKLSPFALLAGFVTGQSVLLVARLLLSKLRQR
jgi:F0F1-type ATP synthase assembly protein I